MTRPLYTRWGFGRLCNGIDKIGPPTPTLGETWVLRSIAAVGNTLATACYWTLTVDGQQGPTTSLVTGPIFGGVWTPSSLVNFGPAPIWNWSGSLVIGRGKQLRVHVQRGKPFVYISGWKLKWSNPTGGTTAPT